VAADKAGEDPVAGAVVDAAAAVAAAAVAAVAAVAVFKSA
jgi:hypothetical protein